MICKYCISHWDSGHWKERKLHLCDIACLLRDVNMLQSILLTLFTSPKVEEVDLSFTFSWFRRLRRWRQWFAEETIHWIFPTLFCKTFKIRKEDLFKSKLVIQFGNSRWTLAMKASYMTWVCTMKCTCFVYIICARTCMFLFIYCFQEHRFKHRLGRKLIQSLTRSALFLQHNTPLCSSLSVHSSDQMCLSFAFFF